MCCVGATLEAVGATKENTLSRYLLPQHFAIQAWQQDQERQVTLRCFSMHPSLGFTDELFCKLCSSDES